MEKGFKNELKKKKGRGNFLVPKKKKK